MTYASEVLADSPLGYWKLDETSGTTVADSSGNGRDGVLTGSPGRSAGAPPGGGFDFDGSSRVNIADDAAWDVTTGLTIETSIFFPATPPSSYRRIFTRDNSSGPQTWTLGTNGGSWDVFIRRGDGSYTAVFGSSTVPADDAWHLVIVESDATSSRLYVDDPTTPIETATGMSSWYASSLGLSIGSDLGGSYAWPEGVAHCAIYDGVLGDTRRAAHWNAWEAAPPINLALSPATVTVTPVAPAVSSGTAQVPLSPATVTVTPQTLAVNAGIVVPLSPATVTVTPVSPGLSLSGTSAALSPATVTVTPQALGLDGTINLALSPATITVTPQALGRSAPGTIHAGAAESGSTVPGGTPRLVGQVVRDWSFTVHDPATGALKATVTTALDGSGWEDVWSDLGSGVLKLAADDTAVASIARGDIVRCTYEGAAAFQWKATRSQLDDTDDTAGVLTWSGPGRLVDLAKARVAPSRGFGAQPVEEVRSFGWTAVDYDDTTWTSTSIELGPQGTPTDWWYGLADWPDPTAEWMWAPGSAINWAPTGDVFFRTTFTVASPGWHTIHLAVDDRGALWLDGQRMLTTQSWDNSNNSIVTVKVVLSAGEHTIAVWGQNNAGEPGNNPAGVLVSVMPEGGGASIFNSGAGWKCYPYPIVPPGITFGSVMMRLLGDVQDRGLLNDLVPSFTAAVDSNGEPWPWLDDVTAKVGTDLWALLKAHAGIDCQVHMPGGAYRLDLYVPDGGGPERPVTFDHPTDVTDPNSGVLVGRHVTAEGTIATSAFVRYDGGWIYVDTAPSAPYSEETVLELRHLTSATDAERVARGILADLARVREQIEVDIAPLSGGLPWHHWWVGDLLSARDTAGTLVTERVVGIAATIRGDQIDVTPTLKDRIAEDIERHEEWLKTMSDGAARGNTSATTPPSLPPPSLPPRAKEKLPWSMPTWSARTGGVHGFTGRITTVLWRLKMDAPVTGTVTSTLRYEGGATIATVTLTAGQQTGEVVAMEIVDNGQAVEWVTTGSETFGGNATLEYLNS